MLRGNTLTRLRHTYYHHLRVALLSPAVQHVRPAHIFPNRWLSACMPSIDRCRGYMCSLVSTVRLQCYCSVASLQALPAHAAHRGSCCCIRSIRNNASVDALLDQHCRLHVSLAKVGPKVALLQSAATFRQSPQPSEIQHCITILMQKQELGPSQLRNTLDPLVHS
jgi:hypothetical protein